MSEVVSLLLTHAPSATSLVVTGCGVEGALKFGVYELTKPLFASSRALIEHYFPQTAIDIDGVTGAQLSLVATFCRESIDAPAVRRRHFDAAFASARRRED